MKRCYRCGIEKPLDHFNKDRTARDGRQGKCRPCGIILRRARHAANIEQERAHGRAYYAAHRKQECSRALAYIAAHRDTAIAKRRVRSAIASGTLIRKPCEVCGSVDDIEGHHEDYSNPLEVTWLCGSHHKRLHAKRQREAGV